MPTKGPVEEPAGDRAAGDVSGGDGKVTADRGNRNYGVAMGRGEGMNGQRREAVVIEDDADIRQLLVIVLSSRGFSVHEAVTGAEGRRLVEETDPQLITLDLNLPDMDGLSLCPVLRAQSHAHILTISARPPQLTAEQCLAAGSDHFMGKPFSPRVLGAYLDEVFPREGVA